MPQYSTFVDKLRVFNKVCKKINTDEIDLDAVRDYMKCSGCYPKKYCELGNIVWPKNIEHKMKYHNLYPSDYFVMIIMNTCILDGHIINPPIQLEYDQISKFSYVHLDYNKLLIIDALMKEGSYPRYELENSYIYSEHSGVISVQNKIVDNIIVSAKTNRIDKDDKCIFLPVNDKTYNNYEYLFHTHPNTKTYGGRIKNGILYEFPSANDLLNFIKYHNEGKAQLSLIVAPEGIYNIRQIVYRKFHEIDPEFFYHLRKFILKLEDLAIKKMKPILHKISNPIIFHKYVGNNFNFIKSFNKFIETNNLYIEYYPREKKNNEWSLRAINLPYMDIA